MARNDLTSLYRTLCENRFACVPRGAHRLREVYALVQASYPHLCDDSYLCSENCKSGHDAPEWQHRVRAGLWYLKKHGKGVQSGSERAVWVFGPSLENNVVLPVAIDDEPPSPERIETTTLRILRDTVLARQIKSLHRHQCQICGSVIDLPNGGRYAEAHHLQPLGSPHDGPDIRGNIVVLCPNHHAMCDYGVIALDVTRLRPHPEHVVAPEFIDYHNSVIYETEGTT